MPKRQGPYAPDFDPADDSDELTERANPQRLQDQGKEMAAEKLADPKIKYSVIGVGALVGLLLLRKLLT